MYIMTTHHKNLGTNGMTNGFLFNDFGFYIDHIDYPPAKLTKYRGVFERNSQEKKRQVRENWSEQLEHSQEKGGESK